MKVRLRPRDDVDVSTWRKTAQRVLSGSWSAITSRKRAERSETAAEDDTQQRQRERQLAEMRKQELREQAERREREQQIADAIKRRVQVMGTWFPGDPL